MASSCNKLMMEAIDIAGHEFKGIELNYKLDEVLGNLKPSMKFTAEQLKGYLLKQGVSPNEIKASKMFEGFETDNRALPISDWNNLGGRQELSKREMQGYEDITLGKQGVDNPTYKVNEFMTATRADMNTNLRHQFDTEAKGSQYSKQSQLGWNRVHQDTINGKPTTVLNELQSDWMQAERQGAGIFESKATNIIPKYSNEQLNQGRELYKQADDIANKFEDFWDEVEKGNPEALEAERLFNEAAQLGITSSNDIINSQAIKDKIIADFPLKPEKFQQLMIVDALNEAITNGTNRVAIPTIRHDNELVGTEGVTKFYQDLNKKVLPDIRKKLEKQGLRVKVSSEDYNTTNPLVEAYLLEFSSHRYKANNQTIKMSIKDLIDDIHKLSFGDNFNTDEFISRIDKAYINDRDTLLGISDDLITKLKEASKNPFVANKLHILEIEEVPNAKVKWDVYGLLSSIGLGAYAINSEANTTLDSSIIATKKPIETNKLSEPIVEEDKPIIMQERPIEINPDDYRDTVGGIKGYIANIESRQAEGIAKYNLKNPNSSALGKYQFTDDTRAQLFKDLKMTPKDLKSPAKQEEAMTYLIGVYKDRLEKWDLPVNKENMFIVHNLGTTGGIRALRGTYTDTDILNMRGNLPEYLAQSNPYEVVKNYSMYYNVDIPITRTLKSMENLPPKNIKK